ncbi:MAG: hypothetical protein ACYDBV_00530 [Nitrospiria bacterium]
MKTKSKSSSTTTRGKVSPKKKMTSTAKKKKSAVLKKKITAKKTVTKKTTGKTVRKSIKKKTTVKISGKKKSPVSKRMKTAPGMDISGTTVISESIEVFYKAPEAQSSIQTDPSPLKGQEVGKITHYYSHLGIGIVEIEHGKLQIGDTVHIKGHTTDFEQVVDSMQIEHQNIQKAEPGQIIGLKVREMVRVNDHVYLKG